MTNYNTPAQVALGTSFSQWVYSFLTPSGLIKDQESIIKGVYQPTNLANLYPQALLAIWLCYVDKPMAKKVLDNLNVLYQQYFSAGPGGMYSGWNTDTNTPNTDSDRYVGNNAWLLLACCHFAACNWGTPDQNRYWSMAGFIASWIAVQVNADGSVYAGYSGHTSKTPDAPILNKINECQSLSSAAIRAYSYFYNQDMTPFADRVEDFLFRLGGTGASGGLLYPAAGRFYAGKDTAGNYYDTHYLDNICWATMMLQDATRLNYVWWTTALKKDLYKSTGFTDKAGNSRIFIEAYAYMAVMNLKQYSLSNGLAYLTSRSNLLSAYAKYFIKSIGFKGGGVPVFDSGEDYTGELTSIAAEPTLWYLNALNYINPLDPTFKVA